jgi:adenine-specific DNA-methyltransferase
VSKASLEVLGSDFSVGDGIFVLSNKEIEELKLNDEEKKLIKPFYTTKELFRYNTNKKNNFWIIYTDSSFKNESKMKNYPNLKSHLDRFQKVITSENKPYGLNRSRNENYFKSEKILVQRKCVNKPSFVYVDFDSYVSRTFIPLKTERISLKYLVALFNSNLCQFWLKNKGKMQGDNFQIDKDPILQIPIYRANKEQYNIIIELVNKTLNTNDLLSEHKINLILYKLYELTYDEILIVDPEFEMSVLAYEEYKF